MAGGEGGKPNVSLDDRWTVDHGRILINGTQAIARVMLDQKRIDAANGWRTAGYVTGYRGSPLGNVDSLMWSIGDRLDAADIRFQPGINEDIAATAVRGTQQLDAVPDPLWDGVFAAWYGKGPGVDRSGDALKHGNYAGAHPKGGVLIFYGDDHGGKSSTVAHHSEQAIAAALIPSLYPADAGEILRFGLLGLALSRYSGSWVGIKCVNEVVEQTLSVDIDLPGFAPVLPMAGPLPAGGIHARAGVFGPLQEEVLVTDHRLPLVRRFVRANGIDRTIFRAGRPRLGIITAGKSHADTMRALSLLGLDADRAAVLGLSLYKLGCIWPVEPEGLREFAAGQQSLLVVEEKKAFVEQQVAAILINQPDRPLLLGKQAEDGSALFHSAIPLTPAGIAVAIADRLERLGLLDAELGAARDRLSAQAPVANGAMPRRSPFFCSGCPHNRSTRIPDGSLSMTGIGCHTMAHFVRPEQALLPTQMGGEGGNWIGLAPFTGTRHMFQNMGDGTYYHSGLLAIRAAVAAGVNITYKILYNDAVAMTGGQPVDGPISVAEIVQQVRHEGVCEVVLVSDDPARHRADPHLPGGLRIEHRDDLDTVQRHLRDVPGCTVLIYEQTCAAEKRRRRKRGRYPDPPKRLFIATGVCEACGDCSEQSTCVSLTPVPTPFGAKRQIDQASCNKDYSCLNGFCPSFITVEGAEPRRGQDVMIGEAELAGLPEPEPAALRLEGHGILLAGIGGTGVITVGAILGMAAHIEGKAASLFDMTGLAQKNGAVFSHVRIAAEPGRLDAQRLGAGETDLLIAFDAVAALSPEAADTLAAGRTRAVINSAVVPTVAFQFDRDAVPDGRAVLDRLGGLLAAKDVMPVDAAALAAEKLRDPMAANLILIGMAAQQGLLPVGVAAIEQAIGLNAVSVKSNLTAFRLGRLAAARAEDLAAASPSSADDPEILDALVDRHAAHLVAYQGPTLAARYRSLVDRVARTEAKLIGGRSDLASVVARTYGRLLAYKDEYEVARLLTDPALDRALESAFEAGGRISYNLAPPILGGRPVNGRPRKRAFRAGTIRPLLHLLKHLKGLRGTPFDLFGHTAERRMERRLAFDYEALVERVLERLDPANLDAARSLLGLAAMIRGFGPVKQAAVEAYGKALPDAEAAFARAVAR
ncbi:indolepyruvate ferredoxin oxidoreductase family protein [Sphingomonas sp. YL-JM2C]